MMHHRLKENMQNDLEDQHIKENDLEESNGLKEHFSKSYISPRHKVSKGKSIRKHQTYLVVHRMAH